MKVKILNYNILHGFHQTVAPFLFEKERLEKAKKIIAAENPDILVLTEASYGGDNLFQIFVDYKKEFNFKYGFFGKWGNYEWGNMILSKRPLIAEIFQFGERTGIKSRVRLGKKSLEIIVIHPSAESNFSEEVKDLEKELEKVKGSAIVSGDLNSISKRDSYDFKRLIKGFKAITNNPKLVIKRLKNQKIISTLKKFGFYDTLKESEVTSTIPTSRYRVGATDIRIDYIFASREIKTIDSGVIKNELTEEASDHYPIFSVIEI